MPWQVVRSLAASRPSDGDTTLVIHSALEKRLVWRPVVITSGTNRLERLVLVLSLLAVVLYASVLPLWEGWDEPFHYGYVENLAVVHRFPILNKSTLTSEISQSLILTPLARFIAEPIVGGISIEQHHALSTAEKRDMRDRLENISPLTRMVKGGNPNYEAQQAPLAYMALTPFDIVLTRAHLLDRIFWLRIIGAFAAIFLSYAGLRRMCVVFAIRPPFRNALLFCALSSQLLWASIAHVGNDWLAIPLTLWFLVLLTGDASLISLSLVLAAGLLTKAYFLSFVPVFVVFTCWRWRKRSVQTKEFLIALLLPVLLAGPWYARNEVLYGTLSGTQESASGITFLQALTAVPHINWFRSALSFFRNSLWIGNWSFTAYSRGTLAIEEILIVGGLLAYLFSPRRASARGRRSAEGWAWAAMVCFVAALFYQTCVTWVHTNGVAASPEPWYWQGVVLFLWGLIFRGLSQRTNGGESLSARDWFGRIWALLMCLTTAWIAASTFAVKLLPGYGGGVTRGTLPAVLNWWAAHPADDLRTITIASPAIVFGLLLAYLAVLIVVVVVLVRRLKTPVRVLETALVSQ